MASMSGGANGGDDGDLSMGAGLVHAVRLGMTYRRPTGSLGKTQARGRVAEE